jgi:hypothetical protein
MNLLRFYLTQMKLNCNHRNERADQPIEIACICCELAGHATPELQSALYASQIIFSCNGEYNACSLFLQCLLAKVDHYVLFCST